MSSHLPKWPIYIVSKGRWESRMTAKTLDAMHVPFRMIVEEQEREQYAAVIGAERLLILDPQFQADYDPCCELPAGSSKGSGPARNFAWAHAAAAGHAWHWCVDDNIYGIVRWHQNAKIMVGDGMVLRAMEEFVERYANVAMAGPQYEPFVVRRRKRRPFSLNTRVYSFNLIRTAVPFRWRGRYNEDTDLSLRMLKAGWCTILFNAFLQKKMKTLSGKFKGMKGGNMEELYKDGTLAKTQMLANLHPDVTKMVWKFSRWHHEVDYSGFTQKLIRKEDGMPNGDAWVPPQSRLIQADGLTYAKDWREKRHGARPVDDARPE